MFFFQVSTFIHYTFALMLTNMYETYSVMMKMILFLHWLLWNISECKRDGKEKINNIENERIAKNGIGFKGYFIIRGRMRYKRSRSYVCAVHAMCSVEYAFSFLQHTIHGTCYIFTHDTPNAFPVLVEFTHSRSKRAHTHTNYTPTILNISLWSELCVWLCHADAG